MRIIGPAFESRGYMAASVNDDMKDEDLMDRVQKGDHGAFSVLVERHTKMFYVAAYRICSNQDDAEDIVQDAFLKLWQRPEVWDNARGAKFTTWFYRVVTNQAIDHHRKHKKTTVSDALDRIKDDRDTAVDVLEEAQKNAYLEEAIQELPERQRIALNLSFYEGVTNKETAEIMDVGVKAVESLIMRAKAGLRDSLIRRGVISEEDKKYGS